jgi:hypothetical protein
VLGKRIPIQEQGNWPKLTNNLISGHFIFHVKVQVFVIAMSYQNLDMDPHWFGSLDPYPDLH